MAKEKTFVIPDDIIVTVDTPEGSKDLDPFAFTDFVRRLLLRDPKWGDNTENLYAAMEVRGALKDKVARDVVVLDFDVHKLLLEIMNKPTKNEKGQGGYVPEVAVQLGPFFMAIKDAKDVVRDALASTLSKKK